MKGLLIKDFRLMGRQKRFFLMLMLIALVMLVVYDDGTTFLIGYITFLCGFFVVSTISYDDFDNGNAFLFTLPISRKEYVQEKYVFGLLLGGGAWLLSSGVVFGYQMLLGRAFDGRENFFAAGAILVIALVLIFIMIPVQLKFGGEKGRMALLGVFVAVFIAGYLIMNIMKRLNVDAEGFLHALAEQGMGAMLGLVVAACAALYLVSYKISVKIMDRKEL